MRRITRAQMEALYALYKRSPYIWKMSYLEFRRTAKPAFFDSCLMVPFCGMTVGIETDGYTHS